MDPWINSLVQSPLVRSLNTVPSRMSSFAHGVKDNVPPFSFYKEVIDPQGRSGWSVVPSTLTASDTASEVTLRFPLPESGLLDRMYLRVRCLNQYTTVNNLITGDSRVFIPADGAGATGRGAARANPRSSSMNFACIFSSASLQTTASKTLETIYPASIASSVQKLPHAQRMFWLQTLNGFAAGPIGGQAVTSTTIQSGTGLVQPFTNLYNPYEPYFDEAFAADASLNHLQHLYVDFLIPLTFSTLDQLKDNFQTRFVENLQVSVTLRKDLAVFSGVGAVGTTGFQASVVAIYHNFHDVIENSIRDQNYKRGFPASVYSHAHVVEDSITASADNRKLTVRLTQQNIVSEIMCVLKRRTNAATNLQYALPLQTELANSFQFTLRGSGRILWQAYSWELDGPDVADYELADGHPYGEDLSHPVKAIIAYSGRSSVGDEIVSSPIALGFPTMHCLRFGFQAHDNYYTGGLALQTISNPTLEIEVVGGTAAVFDVYTFDVVLKTCCMYRIDSDTGVITKTLDV